MTKRTLWKIFFVLKPNNRIPCGIIGFSWWDLKYRSVYTRKYVCPSGVGAQAGGGVTSGEHQGTFAVVTVVVVLVPGAETGPVGGQAALRPRCAAVTSHIQPGGEKC